MGPDISPSQNQAKIDVSILKKKKVNRNDLVAADQCQFRCLNEMLHSSCHFHRGEQKEKKNIIETDDHSLCEGVIDSWPVAYL